MIDSTIHLPMLLDDNLTDIFGYINAGSDYKVIIFTCKKWHRVMTQFHPQKHIELSNHLTTLLKMFPDKPWSWHALSYNPNITSQIVADNLDKPWNWNELSHNPNITWQIILDNPDKPWDWHALSHNQNITWQIIQDNPDKSWRWVGLSRNPTITWQIVTDNPDKPWNWEGLSYNKYSAN